MGVSSLNYYIFFFCIIISKGEIIWFFLNNGKIFCLIFNILHENNFFVRVYCQFFSVTFFWFFLAYFLSIIFELYFEYLLVKLLCICFKGSWEVRICLNFLRLRILWLSFTLYFFEPMRTVAVAFFTHIYICIHGNGLFLSTIVCHSVSYFPKQNWNHASLSCWCAHLLLILQTDV